MGGRILKLEGFDVHGREARLRDLPDRYDLLVIGGGINGCGIALEATRRGYRVLLLDQGDLGGGTSSRSSRLIHGGLRYLREGKVGLVWEASRERHWLRMHYPHLVRPLRFLIPYYRGEGRPWVTRLGLWLYDSLSGPANVGKRRSLTAPQVAAAEPRLRRDGLLGGDFYYDCWTDDFRLVLLNAKMAYEAGAHILPYARVDRVLREDGRVTGVAFHDTLGGGRYEVRGDVVVNAAGPWSDGVRKMVGRSPRLRPTKGVHLFLPRTQVGNMNALVMRSPRDGRFVFALPWRTLCLVGTTDTDYPGPPEEVRAEADDVAYLLEAVNHAFPLARAETEDVVSSYAALRPLAGRLGVPESSVSRREKILWDAPGLLTLIGGKLTTYRRVARRVVRRAFRDLPPVCGGQGAPSRRPAGVPTPQQGEDRARDRGQALGLEPETIDHLIGAFGPELEELYAHLEAKPLREPIVPDLPYVRGEVAYAVRHEMALRLEDVLARRTRVMYEDPNHGLGVARDVAHLMASYLGWDPNRVVEEVERYGGAVAANEAFRRGD
ncbi:MAG: glycerol-3-phosphate dehydrogenase/oxidase [Thermoplasmata archaeon]